jgi:large subunit ribosomal protein L24
MAHVKKGDTVLVIAGKDKGVKGKVLAVYVELDKVLVEGVNRVKKHVKAGQTARGAVTGGILTQEAPIHISNVKLAKEDAPKAKKATKKAAKPAADKAVAEEAVVETESAETEKTEEA